MYKSLWASVSTSGSFQCKLKVSPQLNILTAHLKKQGFHVIFATSTGTPTGTGAGVSTGTDCEIGFCNIRTEQKKGIEGLFMGRFSIVKNDFSASMKAENPNDVPIFVKKFALAKVLKIEV